jgi:G:T-mismatch repair DNA endonuclease (very short patch repair protein)
LSVGRWKFSRTFAVRPDFVFRQVRLAIFVDGCFWHGCPKHATWPANLAAWWRRKIRGNQARDRLVNRSLRRAGWRVLRIWEHELREERANIQHPTSNFEHPMGASSRLVRRIKSILGTTKHTK